MGSLRVLRDYALALLARILWRVVGWLPVRAASALGAWLGSVIGPRHLKHRRVRRNMKVVLSSASAAEIEAVARDSWRNIGALLAELPHVEEIARSRVELDLAPEVQALIDAGEPVLFLTAHLANWEILHFIVANLGFRLMTVYTPDENPFLDRVVQRLRENPHCEFFPKESAVPEMMRAAKQRKTIAVLADVRVDSGELVPFFGRETWTALTAARIGLRAGLPIVPAYAQRLPNARFRFHAKAPLRPAEGLGDKEAAHDVMRQYHDLLEGWILEQPSDWLCTKRRWPSRRKQGRATGVA